MKKDATRFYKADDAHNAWMCRSCGHLERFEADGPFENGWDYCPHCGKRIKVRSPYV